jgi:hypothetical protein
MMAVWVTRQVSRKKTGGRKPPDRRISEKKARGDINTHPTTIQCPSPALRFSFIGLDPSTDSQCKAALKSL